MIIKVPKPESPEPSLDSDRSAESEYSGLQKLGKKSKGHSWSKYLEEEKATAAPMKCFKEVHVAGVPVPLWFCIYLESSYM